MQKQIKVDINYKFILLTIASILALLFAYRIKSVIAMFFIAFILNAGLKPLVTKLASKGVPRYVSIFMIYIFLLAFIVLIVVNVAVEIANQFQSLKGIILNADDEIVAFVEDYFPSIADRLELDTLDTGGSSIDKLKNVSDITPQTVFDTFFDSLSKGFDIVGSVAGGLVAIFSVIIMSIYMLTDKKNIYDGLIDLLPDRYHAFVMRVIKEVEKSLGNWFVGELSLMLIIGFCSYVLVMIPSFFDSGYDLDKYALLIGLMSGILEGLPSLGPLITFITVTLLALLTGASVPAIIFIVIAFLILQQLEGIAIVPMVMKNAVNVNPILSILGVIAGLNLGGPVGALIAIPVIATFQIVLIEVSEAMKKRSEMELRTNGNES
jgi:predicted PurR-regulated permease PerM